MGKKTKAAVIGKRVNGNKIMYHLQIEGQTKWMEYENMVDYVDLVIEYERQRKNRNAGGSWKQRNGGGDVVEIELEDEDEQEGQKQEGPRKQIAELKFLHKKGNRLEFKVTFQDGSFRLMNNNQLKKHYVYELITFYETHIEVGY